MTAGTQYRVSWEMPPANVTAFDYEDVYGPGVWPTLTPAQWRDLPWQQHENVTDDQAGAEDQYNQLRKWAASHEQPIRNVNIEKRELPVWQQLDPAAAVPTRRDT